MPSLNFHPRFVDAIRAGTKRQTIRAPRRHPIKVGDPLYLFTGLRQANCTRIGAAVCKSVEPVVIDFLSSGVAVGSGMASTFRSPADLNAFARRDGFADWQAFADFFARAHRGAAVFTGDLIRWRAFEVAP